MERGLPARAVHQQIRARIIRKKLRASKLLLYRTLNYFFIVSHIFIICFALTGWIWRKTRKLHLLFILLTIFSWTVLGYWFGWGYCFWTDWHWQVRQKLNLSFPNSFVKFLVDHATGLHLDNRLVDDITIFVFCLISGLSFYSNFRNPHIK
jgi:Protein of Unknown function (DUF2784)